MKLNFELVPDSCWYSNLRSILKPKDWDFIRRDAYARAEGKCMICGRKVKRLEAHEKWSYNMETQTQKLEEVIAVCHACHSVIHIGRAQLIGEEERAIKHFCYVNKCSYSQYIKALGEANILHQERNKVGEWKVDLTYLQRYIKD